MDVCLVLTHRCNLACGYCYAGEHHGRQMEDTVLDRAVDLLFSDGAEVAQLSFFGGEPFLRFAAMTRAVERARRRADERGAELLLQCTTNGTLLDGERVRFAVAHGMRVTLSIDGVREAHDLHRPRAGGASSFDACHRGLHVLLDGGARTDAAMVISPQTVPFVSRSVSWLWSEGIEVVRTSLVLDATWELQDRNELREQLWAVAAEMVARRRSGEAAELEALADRRPTRASRPRPQVVVATDGDLYPCAPMVGEDSAAGPEAGLRIGHLSDGPERIAESVASRGAGCARGVACACAAYLETASRTDPGPIGVWYGHLCARIRAAIADQLREVAAPRGGRRRPFLIGLAAAVGGAAIAGSALLRAGLGDDPPRAAIPPRPARLEPPPEAADDRSAEAERERKPEELERLREERRRRRPDRVRIQGRLHDPLVGAEDPLDDLD